VEPDRIRLHQSDIDRAAGGPPRHCRRSNRQAADELYVSVKTVESHLGHIFAKLDTRFRQDLITGIDAPDASEPLSGSHLGSGPDDNMSAAGDDNNRQKVRSMREQVVPTEAWTSGVQVTASPARRRGHQGEYGRQDRGAVARRPGPPIHSLPTSSATVAKTGQSEVAS
jgi:Bacterial regulatory proteins, luxR family